MQVALRVRPLAPHEAAKSSETVLQAEPGYIQLNAKAGARQFKFTYNLGPEQSQQQLFEGAGVPGLLESALNGFSATVFAYGQTGSGKTYTIVGRDKEAEGLVPRSIRWLYQRISGGKDRVQVKASYLEIYNEQIRDLLNPASGVLHCRYNQNSGFYVEELIVVDCSSEDDLFAVLK